MILVAAGTALLYFRFRHDVRAARERIAAGGKIAETPCGRIEYAEQGEGRAVLVSHGAGGGYDQGLAVSERLGAGLRIIAPSRFGYLGMPYPDDPSAAEQADAYACLLDALGVARVVVIAFSAGGPSALQFALRHPARTDALIMVSAISDGSLVDPRPVDPSKDPALSTMLHDFPFWLAVTCFPDQVLRFFGMTREAQRRLTPEEHGRAVRVVRMILPMGMRATGNFNDPAHWFERGDFALESIRAPTLVIHARDDTFVAFAHGEYTARHIPNARLASFDYGGHFVIVRDAVAAEISTFLRRVGN
ncbi:MAG TPA: alpha/beta hydrolase [Thermoanaerobaculia bacterium]|nr:alpha/beta hydrolase [Thermoanaerobaculia bacterium]